MDNLAIAVRSQQATLTDIAVSSGCRSWAQRSREVVAVEILL